MINAWYLLTFPAWAITSITMTARLADMGHDQWKLHHHLRRFGLTAIGCAGLLMIAGPFTTTWWMIPKTNAAIALLSWSLASVWMTTPGMPPWWDFILGVHRQDDNWNVLTFRQKVWSEIRALRASFHRQPSQPEQLIPDGDQEPAQHRRAA
jgi:hypothetical protein